LEYSVAKDAVFCFYCYFFSLSGGSFLKDGFSSGRGLNQETTLQRPGDTRWGSHYNCLINLIVMFSTIVNVVEKISTDITSSGTRGDACISFELMLKFEFAFYLHLIKKILGISNELSKVLQRKDQDIINAIRLVQLCKLRLQTMRDDG